MSVPNIVQAGLRRTNELFATTVREQKFDLLDGVYTEDARILPPGAALVEGRSAIKRFWQQAVTGMGVKDAALSSLDVEMAGESVVEIGRGVLTLNSGQAVTAKYVVHWKQEDGQWKWHTDIWNMNE